LSLYLDRKENDRVVALRSAIIGAGFSGTVNARAARAAGGVVVGIAASNLDHAHVLASEVAAEHSTTSALALIERDDVDVVHVCTPNVTHAEFVEAAFAARKHVICEKPLATNWELANSMTIRANAAGVLAAVPFVYRFYPMVRELRERARAGLLGDIGLIHGEYLQDWLAAPSSTNWRVDPLRGGASRAFADIGVHWTDLVEFVSHQRITEVNATFKTVFQARESPSGSHAVDTEDLATIMFTTDGDAAGSVVVSQVAHGRKNRFWLSIDGSASSIGFDHDYPEQLWIGGSSANQVVVRSPENLSAAAARYSTLPGGHPQGYQDCFNAFVKDCYAAARGENTEGLPVFADGLRAASITEAVLASASSRSWTSVR